MRPLWTALSAVSLLLGSAASVPLQAQERWNDDRTMVLVSQGIARRAAQLADSSLTDYTARAHGYLTFLAQLGEGFPDPPKVVKSDELAVEVYWRAPDQSKQRIIGRRDTLLLPTDINYHRDHLAIVQNNFPSIIRLGDGDEVRDVAHPLSAAGLAEYDYRIADSLAIRTNDRAIDVIMIAVRPKDPRRPAAVGAVHVERGTGNVIRMTLSFTRAALKDPQLEDVSVILENGLVDGRFWLPRRQEIEIRRSGTWLDFPARGIIRGRWEICCVETNGGLPAELFSGPEVVDAPLAVQRAHKFEGASILAGLPDEVRALDDPEVRKVQEEARALVQAAALSRASKVLPSARAISDIIRVNRVEGLALGGGLARAFAGGLAIGVRGRYGFADHAPKGELALRWTTPTRGQWRIRAYDDFAQAGQVAEVSGVRNSIAAQEWGVDWTQPFGVRGGALGWNRRVGGGTLTAEGRHERQRPLAVSARPEFGSYEPVLAAEPLSLDALSLRWAKGSTPRLGGTWKGEGVIEGARRRGAGGDFVRSTVQVEGSRPVGGGVLKSATLAGWTSAGAPLQAGVRFGGIVSGPGYDFQAVTGTAGISQRIEWEHRIPFVRLSLGRFGRIPATATVAPYLHSIWIEPSGASEQRWFPSVGVGSLMFFDLLRLDVARGLRGGRWTFSVDLQRDLWPVL